jgi:hypothetical protein
MHVVGGGVTCSPRDFHVLNHAHPATVHLPSGAHAHSHESVCDSESCISGTRLVRDLLGD